MLGFLDRAVDLAEKRRLRHQIVDHSDLNNNNEEQKTRPATSSVVQAAEKDAVVLRVDWQMTEASTTLKLKVLIIYFSIKNRKLIIFCALLNLFLRLTLESKVTN